MKYCTQCGNPCIDQAAFCEKCGRPFYEPVQAPRKDYTKLGGWLLFFVIWNIIGLVGGIAIAVSSVRSSGSLSLFSLNYGEGNLPTFVFGIFYKVIWAGECVLALLHIIQIFKKNHGFMRSMQINNICAIVLMTMISAQQILVAGDTVAWAVAIINAVGQLLGLFLGMLLTTLYYCRSRRVRAYMGGTEYQDKALFRFKDKNQA